MQSRYYQETPDSRSNNPHYPIQQREISRNPYNSYSRSYTLRTPQANPIFAQQGISQSRPIQQGYNPRYRDPLLPRRQPPPVFVRVEPDFNSNPDPPFENRKINFVKNSYSRKFIPPKSESRKIAQPFQENYSNQNHSRDYPRVNQCYHQERSDLQNFGRRLATTQNSNYQEQNCPICFDPIHDEEPWVELTNCYDIFHCECLEQELQMRIDERSFPINCPQCRKDLHVEDIRYTLQNDPRYQDKFEKYSFQAFINSNPEKFDRCQTPDCDYAERKNLRKMRFDCPECGMDYCKRCQANWTIGHSCETQNYYYASKNRNQQISNYYNNVRIQNQTRQIKNLGFTDQEFENWADGKGYKACPKCGIMIERSEGCPHMTCMCGTEFCYSTGEDWKQCSCGKH